VRAWESLDITKVDDLDVRPRGSLAWAAFTFGADVVSKEDKRAHTSTAAGP